MINLGLQSCTQEDELVDAVNRYCPPSKMTPAERKRNEFGKTWRFRYDPSMAETLRSTHPTAYLDITPSRSTVEVCPCTLMPQWVEFNFFNTI